MTEGTQRHFRTCNLCEALCGIVIEHDGARVLSIRGDDEDPLSRGYICPKAVALRDVHDDPDRLRRPQKRVGDRWIEVEWAEAFREIGERLRALRNTHGRDAVAFYQGNPTVHNYGSLMYGTIFGIALGTRHRYSATSVDQLPRMLVSLLMYGHQLMLPVPDVDRAHHFLMLGANPLASNGSLMTAPGIGRRLKDLRARGGKLVVVDPRRTETAAIADEHLFIRPGTDALFVLALVHTVLAEGRADLGRLAPHVDGFDAIAPIAARFSPERVADAVGIDAQTIRRVAREFASARPAVCYGRVGTCLQEFGTLATWAIDLLNIVTGNLDREGGFMFTTPAVDLCAIAARTGLRGSFDAFRSRVRGLPEFGGELPVVTLAEEIETPGDGQVRALFTSCGNPVLSTPNGARLSRALDSLELMVSVDLYRNETTRHANFILPPTFALEHDNYGAPFHLLAVRNTAKYCAPLFDPPPDSRHDWQIFAALASELVKGGAPGRVAGAALGWLGQKLSPHRTLDLLLRTGPHGDRFLPWRRRGLSLAKLKAAPHGIDLGPLEPCLPAALYTESERIRLVPREIAADLDRLQRDLDARERAGGARSLVLIGRRDLRSNNSWMHNSERLVKGPARCTLRMHPDDARARGLESGALVQVRSRVGSVVAPLEVSDAMMPGVVSLPHGWGHDRDGTQLAVARARPGVSVNDVTDETLIDELSGNAALNGVPVTVERAKAVEARVEAAE